MTAAQAWVKLANFLKTSGKKESYAPETIAECKECFVFSIRLRKDPPGVSTGLNPYVVYKATGKVIQDCDLSIVSKLRPIKMVNPSTVG